MGSRRKVQSGKETLAARLRPIAQLEALLGSKQTPARLLLAARTAAPFLSGETTELIAALINSLEDEVARNLSELPADLRDLAQKNKWRLEGSWPTFQIERGLELRVEATKGLVRIAGVPFDATDMKSIEAAIGSLVAELVPKAFSAEVMLEQLRRAYSASSGMGRQIAILEIYGRYVIESQSQRFWRDARPERFTGISVDQFRARLSRMLEEGTIVARDGTELRLLPPLDPKDALFVFLPLEGRFGYVGRVEFIERPT